MTARQFRGAFVWLADKSGVAHAHRKPARPAATACGAPVVDIRLAWPERERCPRCMAVLGFGPEPS